MNAQAKLDDLLQTALNAQSTAHQLRARRVIRALDATHIELDGKRYVNFASNDYLGLSHHPAVIAAARNALLQHGAGSGASAMITGYTEVHQSAEAAIARWKGTEAAVLVPSGYQANHAAVQAVAGAARLAGRRLRFLLDKLVHASIIDAVRSTEAAHRIFPHNNLAKLDRLLAQADPDEMQVIITESIFSMDGDAADLAAIAALRRSRRFVLMLDEAHASGVYRRAGAGFASEYGLEELVDVSVTTFSKALGFCGAAVCGSKALCTAVVNFGRAYMYSTSVPPSLAAAVEAALEVLRSEPDRQQRVRATARRVRDELQARGVCMPPGDSPIIPVILGSEEAAVAEAERLMRSGIFVIPIRPPTVARGTSRLRITLSSEHSAGEVEHLLSQSDQWKWTGRVAMKQSIDSARAE